MDALREIEILIGQGAKRLNAFFYVGVAIGLVMGLLVLAASFVPSVQETIAAGENDLTIMRIFGAGMTVLLGIASIEQYVKVRRDRKVLSTLARNPQKIVAMHKETSKAVTGKAGGTLARFTHVYLTLKDGTQSKVWLPNADANRLIDLLQQGALIFCPYCMSPIHDDSVVCPECEGDVTADAPFEMTLAEYVAKQRKACVHCGAEMMSLAVRCSLCKKRQ